MVKKKKKPNKMFKIIFLILLIFIAIIFVLEIKERYYTCSLSYPQNCDKSCLDDDDCRKADCTCINKKESYTTQTGIIFGRMGLINCEVYSCECINNECRVSEYNNNS